MNIVSVEKIVVHYHRYSRTMFGWAPFLFLGITLSVTFAEIALSSINKVKLGQGIVTIIFMITLDRILSMLLERSKQLFLNKNFLKLKWGSWISAFIMFAIIRATFPFWQYIPFGLTIFRILSSTLIVCCISMAVHAIYVFLFAWKLPVITLDQRGILVNHIGFISWNNIASITPYSMVFDEGIRGVGIKIKDAAALAAQADWQGKLRLLLAKAIWQRLCRADSHIYVSTVLLDTPNDVIIAFANQYTQNDMQN